MPRASDCAGTCPDRHSTISARDEASHSYAVQVVQVGRFWQGNPAAPAPAAEEHHWYARSCTVGGGKSRRKAAAPVSGHSVNIRVTRMAAGAVDVKGGLATQAQTKRDDACWPSARASVLNSGLSAGTYPA